MKLSEAFRFPHPVLSETSGDYPSDAIDFQLVVEEQPQNGALKLNYNLTVESPTIVAELHNQSSAAFLSVVCRDTFFNEFYPISLGQGEVNIDAGLLYSRVAVRAVVVRLKEGYLDASGLQADYSISKFSVDWGALLGWTIPLLFSVGMDKLAPMESVFKLSKDDSLDKDKIGVSFDGDYVSIRASEELLQTISALRATSLGRPIVLTSVYMPAIMTVLEAIKEGGGYQDRRWHRVISAKADSLGVDLSKGEAISAVQALLKSPLGRLKICMEKF